MIRALIAAAALIASPAASQSIPGAPPPVDTSQFATASSVQAAKDAADAAIAASATAKAAADAAAARAVAAQAALPDLTPYAKVSDVATVQSTIMAAMPQRATTLPPMEKVNATVGTSMRYRGADDVQPRITRTAACTLVVSGGIGSCDTTWEGSPFPAGTIVRLAGSPAITTVSVGANTEQPMTCKAYAVTVTGIGFRCWQAQSSALSLNAVTTGVVVLPFSAPAGTITVSVTALPSS